jgi:hypothetical protein
MKEFSDRDLAGAMEYWRKSSIRKSRRYRMSRSIVGSKGADWLFGIRRLRPNWARWFVGRWTLAIGIVLCGLAAVMAWDLAASPWTVSETIRHKLSARNCAAARLMGLAPARRGQPGYYPSHDADNDGIACEPWPRR